MSNKVLLILVDGMRPDSISAGGGVEFEEFFKSGSYSFQAKTTFPPVTLPCHMSLFHSVDPGRHGITTNTYIPQVRPIKGLVEVLTAGKKTSAFAYTWEELRDLSRPGDNLEHSWFMRHRLDTVLSLDHKATAAAKEMIQEYAPDFVFLYLAGADIWGHQRGWMSQEYLDSVKNAWECIQKISTDLPEEYTVIVTADHGGHNRRHGDDIPEDMTIPVVFKSRLFPKGKELEHFDIRDIAPTIVDILGVEPDPEWEGKSIVKH
ncbi:MAG: alkaline phosphatase family protein [Oscillospiraceae bacterium]|jgi:predicted AlkP superfamily pyrophosphatase or phosphodiesterase